MAKQYAELSTQLIEFIAAQKIFFVGTATADSRVNVSPKGLDSFKISKNAQTKGWLWITNLS